MVGYSMADRMKARITVDTLANAVTRWENVTECIVPSGRGSQSKSRKFLRALEYHRLVGSIVRMGAAGDDTAMNSFFALLQNNALNWRTWVTREQLQTAIV